MVSMNDTMLPDKSLSRPHSVQLVLPLPTTVTESDQQTIPTSKEDDDEARSIALKSDGLMPYNEEADIMQENKRKYYIAGGICIFIVVLAIILGATLGGGGEGDPAKLHPNYWKRATTQFRALRDAKVKFYPSAPAPELGWDNPGLNSSTGFMSFDNELNYNFLFLFPAGQSFYLDEVITKKSNDASNIGRFLTNVTIDCYFNNKWLTYEDRTTGNTTLPTGLLVDDEMQTERSIKILTPPLCNRMRVKFESNKPVISGRVDLGIWGPVNSVTEYPYEKDDHTH